MSADQLTALLKFLRASSTSWGATCRTVVLIAGTIWIPLIGLAAVLGRTGQLSMPTAIASTGIGLGVAATTTHRGAKRSRARPTDATGSAGPHV